jgi:5-methylcytosine-specific restriction endonuclease McrA
LFAACSRKSYEQVEVLLAERFPKADVRDLIRRLPARTAESAPDIGTNRAAASEASTGAAPCPPRTPDVQQAAPIQPVPREPAQTAPAPARGAVKPLAEHRFSVNFTADSEFRELLEEVRALASHTEASDSLMSLMKLGLQALRGELLKKRFGVGRKPRRMRARPQHREAEERSRQVPAAVAREVYERDGGCCTFCSKDGRRCGTRELLQFDHIIPFASGGESTLLNLQLRCRAHNLHAARQHFGAEYMRTAVVRARDRTCQQRDSGHRSAGQ